MFFVDPGWAQMFREYADFCATAMQELTIADEEAHGPSA
jgi:hypothetical protein